MKEKVKRKQKDILRIKKEIENFYILKYWNLFTTKYKIDGIDYQEKRFLFREFWNKGTIAAFKLKHFETEENPNGKIGFAPYAVSAFNMYLQPAKVNLINLKGVNAIPAGMLEVDKEVILGWVQPNRISILEMLRVDLNAIINIEMLIRDNGNALKMPFVIASTPEEEYKLKALVERIINDEEVLFLGSDELEKIQVLLTQAPYLLDKLEQNLDYRENRIKTLLGINNVNIRKKERLITDEANSNNEEIQTNRDVYIAELKDFFERIKNAFGIVITIEVQEEKEEIIEENSEVEEDVE